MMLHLRDHPIASKATPLRVARRFAFSMAELLIALSILGFGLAIIATTLPAGLRVMERNQERRQADATTDIAVEDQANQIRISSATNPVNPGRPGVTSMIPLGYRYQSMTSLSSPDADPNFGFTDPNIESNYLRSGGEFVIDGLPTSPRVFPLVMWNVEYEAGDSNPYTIVADREPLRYLYEWLEAYDLQNAVGTSCYSYYVQPYGSPAERANATTRYIDKLMPAMRPSDRVIPPVLGNTYRTVDSFFNGNDRYEPLRLLDGTSDEDEFHAAQMLDRRLAYTVFYRPIDVRNSVYEMITLVTRRPSADHFFPVQKIDNNVTGFDQMNLQSPEPEESGSDVLKRVAPVPWLVAFEELPFDGGDDLDISTGRVTDTADRAIEDTGPLVFRCSDELDPLLPIGSRFFPAINLLRGGISHVALRLGDAEVTWNEFSVGSRAPENISLSYILADTNTPSDARGPINVGGQSVFEFSNWPSNPNEGPVASLESFGGGIYLLAEAPGLEDEAFVLSGSGLAFMELPIAPIIELDGTGMKWDLRVNLRSPGSFVEIALLPEAPTQATDLERLGTPLLRLTRNPDDSLSTALFAGPGASCEIPPIDPSATLPQALTPFDVLLSSSSLDSGGFTVDIGGATNYYNSLAFGNERQVTAVHNTTGVLPIERSKSSLPIFEIIDRPDQNTVVVRNDGLAPWTLDVSESERERECYWPVWIIPPAFQGDEADELEYSPEPSILSVESRVVRLQTAAAPQTP